MLCLFADSSADKGVHRSIGSHISKVRSLELDVSSWPEEQVVFFEAVGNKRLNAVLESLLDPHEKVSNASGLSSVIASVFLYDWGSVWQYLCSLFHFVLLL